MNLRVLSSVAAAALLGCSAAHGAMITNGDFADCSLSGWQTDSDLTPGYSDDVSVINDDGTCAALMTIDESDAFANILYQTLDLSAASGSQLWLDISFSVDSMLTDQEAGTADYFSVYLFDGMGGFFDNTLTYGGMYDTLDINGAESYTQSFLLDPSLNNQEGWSLEFQLNSNFDGASSQLQLFSVALREVSDVPSPASASLALLAVAGLLTGRQRKTQGGQHA